MTLSICIFYLNLCNGFSGQQPIESLVFGVINVNLTPLVIVLYMIFEVEVSRRKYGRKLTDEDRMPYTMSDLYAYTRSSVAKFYQTHFAFVLYGFYTGAVIFFVYYMGIESGGIMFTSGWTQDLFSFGVLTVMTVVIQHHLHVAMMMRSWTFYFTIGWLFSLGQLFLIYVLAEMLMSS